MLKEQFEDRLPEVFEKIEALEEERRQDIVLKTDEGSTVRILCSGICYIERVGRRTKITADNEEVIVREKISELEAMLPGSGFARCHNSIIVNLAKVREIYRSSLLMSDGTELLISRGHSRDFRMRYMNWVKERVI